MIRYAVLFLLRRNTKRVALLLLLAALMVARSLDVLIMVHSCFDLSSVLWWSLAYPVATYFVVRADSLFFRKYFATFPQQDLGHLSSNFGRPRITRPRGDTVSSTPIPTPFKSSVSII